MKCPGCGNEELEARCAEPGSAAKVAVIECAACGQSMRLTSDLLEAEPGGDSQLSYWDAHYEAEDQGPVIGALEAGFRRPGLLVAHYPMVRLLESLPLPLGSSIELGCGSGSFSLLLKKLGIVKEVTLLDYSTASLEAAHRLFEHFGESCTLVHSAIESAPFQPGAFDLALSAGVIEHYRTPLKRLGCLQAHLELGRFTFVQAPVSSPFYWLSRTAFTVLNRGWPFGYEKPSTTRELRGLASSAGARVLGLDHQYFTSFHLFTRLHWLPRPGWYTFPFMNEIAILARRD